jgi:uncharacterized membrane protein
MTNLQYNRGAINASDCIGQAWNLVTRNLGLYIGVNLVAGIILVVIGCIPFASVFLTGPVTGGLYYIALRDINGEPIDFGMMFKGFEKFVPLMVVGVIQGIPAVILQIVRFTVDIASFLGRTGSPPARRGDFFQAAQPDLSVLAGLSAAVIILALGFLIFTIIWNMAFYFTVPLIVEYGIGPIDAIKYSASAALSNIGGLILLIILDMLVALLGIIAICFGLLVAIPVIWVGNAFAYRLVFPRLNQNFWTTPPPPSAYGSSFGQGM